MADNTKIEWTDATVNFWWGCTKVGPGCDHCYAETWSRRTGEGIWGPGVPRRPIKSAFSTLAKLNASAARFIAEHGRARRVFIQSMSDLFDKEVPLEWFATAWGAIWSAGEMDVQIVTKRLPMIEKRLAELGDHALAGWPRHAGLLISVVNQEEADRDIPRLIALKKKLGIPWIGLSMEPLLGLVVLRPEWLAELGWVIVGGESGPHARPLHPDWARALCLQCMDAGVPFFFKQWGEWEVALDRERDDPDWRADYSNNYVDRGKSKWLNLAGGCGFHGERFHVMRRVGKKDAGRLLDGVEHNGFPGIANEGQAVPEPLKRIIARVTHPVLSPSIEADTRLRDDLKLDDLDLQTIALDCDVEWGIEIRDLEWRGWVTPASVAATIEKHTGNRS